MATIGSNVATLIDHAKRMDPDGKVAKIVEMLGQTNDILMDMQWKEGNLPTGHRVTVRTGLPSVTWRLLNRGVPKGKSTTAQVDEATGMLEARSEVDKDLAMLNGNTAQFRLSEGSAFLEAMNQEMASSLFYGNHLVAPEEFTGLSPRYSSLSAENARNIINGGGAGSDNTSIWLIVWGEETVHGIFPKGSQAGLVHEDLGEGDAFDSSNNRFRAFMDRWQWKCGLALKDWRFAVRICNIDVSALTTESSAADLIKLMSKATHRIQNLRAGKAAFYMNRTVIQMLDVQRQEAVKAGGGLTFDNVDGQVRASFRGIPVRLCDALLETEEAVA